MSKVKAALIGYGHLGRWHADKMYKVKNCEFVGIVESDVSKHQAIAEKFPGVKVVATYEDVLNDVDAFVIATPTSTHFSLMKQLIQKNKHVFCEKPLCERESQALELQQMAAFSGVKVQVGHSERFHAAFEKLAADSSWLQSPCTIQMTRVAPFKGRATDVDVVQDLMVHDLDLLSYLFKEQPRSVISAGHKSLTNHWDFVCSTFRFSSGAMAIITVGRNHYKETREIVVSNDNGCTAVDLMHNKIYRTKKGILNPEQQVEEESYEKRDHLLIENELFFKSILEDSEPIVTCGDGVNAVKLVNKVLESLEQKMEVSI